MARKEGKSRKNTRMKGVDGKEKSTERTTIKRKDEKGKG